MTVLIGVVIFQALIIALKHKLKLIYYRKFLSEEALPALNKLLSENQNYPINCGESKII